MFVKGLSKGITLMVLAIGVILIYGFSVKASDLPEFPKEGIVQQLSSTQLDELRGRYVGFYLAVTFEWFWENPAATSANVDVDWEDTGRVEVRAATGDNDGEVLVTVNDPGSSQGDGKTQVRSIAAIGGLNGAKGIFQINQVPGSLNVVRNNLTIDLDVFIVREPGNIRTLHTLLPFH
ncbi:MAG TPA: hypothetical protein ENF44_06545 [Deltaproteobacteria bacterium]|nr:hypothetical protein [Deltaproteobacteria bacterium]